MADVRFTPNDFLYNGRVAIALLPSLLVFASLGGRFVVGILTLGSMIAYIMDALQLREGACTTLWLMLFLSNIGLTVNVVSNSYEHPAVLVFGAIIAMWCVLGAVFAWATLQFKWIQMQYPGVALALERLVVSVSFPVAAVALTIGTSAITHASSTPIYVLVILCSLYYTLCRPLPSSFQPQPLSRSQSSKAPSPTTLSIQSKADGLWSAILLVTLPASMYTAIHWIVIFRTSLHLWTLLLLISLPIVFLCVIPNGLWWVPGPPHVVNAMRYLWLTVSLASALVGFEGRVVFVSFGEYIKLQPPWNWLAVTCALFGFALVVLAHFAGFLSAGVDVTLAGTVLLLCTTAGSLAAGIPFIWLPAPLLSACGLALYYDTRSLREYSVFVVGAVVTAAWFLHSHFWFLDFAVQGMPVHILCKMAMAAVIPALLIPGLVSARSHKLVIGLLLLLQAALLTLLEAHLYPSGHMVMGEEEVMYPSYLLVATSAVGLVAVRRLQLAGQCHHVAGWLAACLYGSKVVMLLLPQQSVVLPALLLAIAVTPPLVLYGSETAPNSRRRTRISPSLGLFQAAVVVLAVAYARFAIFDLVQWLGAARPTESLLLGSLTLTVAAGCAPLVAKCFPSSGTAKRALCMVTGLGLLLVLVQPPLPIRGGARCPKLPFNLCPRLWDERHVPLTDNDDVMIWGTGLGTREHWPRWLLLAASMVGVVAAPTSAATPRPRAAPALLAGVSGLLIGAFLALEVLPGQVLVQGLVVVASLVVTSLLALMQQPASMTPGWLPLLLLLWAALVVVALALQAVLPLPELPEEMMRLYPDELQQVDQERALTYRSSLLAVFTAQSLLLAFSLKLKIASAMRSADKRALGTTGENDNGMFPQLPSLYKRGSGGTDFFCGVVPSNIFSSFSKMLRLEGAAGMRMQRLAHQGLSWMPTAGNLLTLVAFLTALMLANRFTDGAAESIFMLAPLLLLLSQDSLILPGLGEQQRYFPPVLAASTYLTIAAAYFSVMTAFSEAAYLDATVNTVPWWFVCKNLLLLMLALPNHLLFLSHLWTPTSRSSATLMLVAPLNLLVLWLADIAALQYLAGAGLAMAALQYFSSRHIRHADMRMI